MDYLKAFAVGGAICVIGQILIDKTKLTPARILVSFVCIGAFLSLIGVYKPLFEYSDGRMPVSFLKQFEK